MITTIVLTAIALVWLGYETAWLTIRLPQYESLESYDKRILAAMIEEGRPREEAYQNWLQKLYEPKESWWPQPDHASDYPQDSWMTKQDDLRSRRNGEAIYQRGKR